MKKVWKWIIGIVIGLVVLAVLLGVGLMLFSGFHGVRTNNGYVRGWTQQGPGMMPYQGFGDHMRGPGMMGRSEMIPFGGFFAGLICLGFLALLVVGIVLLIKYLRKPNQVDATNPVNPPAAAMPAMDTCKKCGKPIQVDWKNCPYCGKKV